MYSCIKKKKVLIEIFIIGI